MSNTKTKYRCPKCKKITENKICSDCVNELYIKEKEPKLCHVCGGRGSISVSADQGHYGYTTVCHKCLGEGVLW